MIPRPYYVLPAQRVIFERGGLAGLPLANEAFSSKWWDVYQVHKGGIQVPQSGAIVSGGSEIRRGVGTTLRVGAYYLDLFCEHDNASGLPFTVNLNGAVADALEVAGPPTILMWTQVVQASGIAAVPRPTLRRFPLLARFVQISWTYAAANATRFSLSAVLRAF